MVLPVEIFSAARTGDRDAVLAYLDTQDDAGDARDVNEQTVHGGSVLMAAVCQIDSAANLAFVWELVRRGADLASFIPVGDDVRIGVFDMAVSGMNQGNSRPESFRDFVLQWLGREDLVLSAHDGPRVSPICEVFARGHSSRPIAEVVFALVRAGAPLYLYSRETLELYEARHPQLARNEHWLACKHLILGVRAAGSWRAYARLPRKRVLRLRSLMLRGRAKPRRTGGPNVVARVFKLPNEMVWKVLAFWRVESEVTHGGGNIE